jgi:hypothetical protein
MNEYIEQLTARQVIEMIANEWVELSHDKVRIQRDDHIRWCKKWLELNPERQSPLDEVRSAWAKRKELGE